MDSWPAAAEHLGGAYLRYSFTKGTEQEVGFLVDVLGLRPGMRVLDVGCGPGRHAHALAARGIAVHGVDISPRFVELAVGGRPNELATFSVGDARALAFDDEFDAVISLCQGGFGLVGEDDPAVLQGIARAVRRGGGAGRGGCGRVALSAFSAYFAVRFLDDADDFDADAGVNTERTSIKSESGDDADFVLRTSCFTPRELRLLCERSGLTPEHIWSVAPGAYARTPPNLSTPEFLVIATPTPA